MAERMPSDVIARGGISTFVFNTAGNFPPVSVATSSGICDELLGQFAAEHGEHFKPFVQTEPGRTTEQRGISNISNMKPLDIFKKETSGHSPVTSLQITHDSSDQDSVNSLLTCSVSLSWNYAGFHRITSPGTKSGANWLAR